MRKYLKTTFLLLAIGLLALMAAYVGWLQQGHSATDALFKAVHVLSLGSDYDVSATWQERILLSVARWLGLAFITITALKVYGLLLSRQVADIRAQVGRLDIALVGDHPGFASLAEAAARRGRKVLWLAPPGEVDIAKVDVIARRWSISLASRFRILRAREIVIAFPDHELRSLDTAVALREKYPASKILLITTNSTIADSLRRLPALNAVQVTAAAMPIVRMLLHGHPPFLIAQENGQARLHCLIIGCGDMGEALISGIILSSLTTFLGKPRFTIVDPRAEEISASMAVRQPEIMKTADFEFLTSPYSEDIRALPVKDLIASHGDCPITAAYICIGDDLASLNAAIALDRFALDEGWNLACFVRQRVRGSSEASIGKLSSGRIVSFGGVDDLAGMLGLFGDDPDMFARQLHLAYRRLAPATAVANVSWDDLHEEFREANRNALLHLPAKLASAGVPLDDWLKLRRDSPAFVPYPVMPFLEGDPQLLQALSVLEHERWMAERRLAGWRFGAARDDARRLHPDLVPFEQLKAESQALDRTMVLQIAAELEEARAISVEREPD